MDEAAPIEIHCSALPSWAQCEKAAIERHFYPRAGEDKAPHVAGWIGSCVHAVAADADPPPAPKAMRFDKITPGQAEAIFQIDSMSTAVRQALRGLGSSAAQHETHMEPVVSDQWPLNLQLVGTCDLIAMLENGTVLLADIKTGREIHPSWLQLGGYAMMLSDSRNSMHPTPTTVATIHCPRPSDPLEPAWAEVYYNEMDQCMAEAERVMNRIAQVITFPEMAVAAPGNRCRFCDHPSCVVRVREFAPR